MGRASRCSAIWPRHSAPGWKMSGATPAANAVTSLVSNSPQLTYWRSTATSGFAASKAGMIRSFKSFWVSAVKSVSHTVSGALAAAPGVAPLSISTAIHAYSRPAARRGLMGPI